MRVGLLGQAKRSSAQPTKKCGLQLENTVQGHSNAPRASTQMLCALFYEPLGELASET